MNYELTLALTAIVTALIFLLIYVKHELDDIRKHLDALERSASERWRTHKDDHYEDQRDIALIREYLNVEKREYKVSKLISKGGNQT